MIRVAEAVGCPIFMVERFPASELSKWSTYFAIQHDLRTGKPLISPETISVEESQNNVIELFKRMATNA